MTAVAIVNQGPPHRISTAEERPPVPPATLSFPPFRLDFVEERLWKGQREVRLPRKPFAMLRYLAQNPRRLVTHAELTEAVWGRIVISESLLRTHMHRLRQSLGEPVVETVLGRGYRFVASLSDGEDSLRAELDEGTERARAAIPLPMHTPEQGELAPVESIRLPGLAGNGGTDAMRLSLSAPQDAILGRLAEVLGAATASATVFGVVRDSRDAQMPKSLDASDTRVTRHAMRGCPSYESLVAMWAGDLGRSEAAVIEEHLFQCDACATKTQRLAKIAGAPREESPFVKPVRH